MTVYAGQQIRVNVRVEDPDGDEFDVTTRGMPRDAMWNRQAGKFRWTPTASDAGEHVIHFRAEEDRNDNQEVLVGEVDFVSDDFISLIKKYI